MQALRHMPQGWRRKGTRSGRGSTYSLCAGIGQASPSGGWAQPTVKHAEADQLQKRKEYRGVSTALVAIR